MDYKDAKPQTAQELLAKIRVMVETFELRDDKGNRIDDKLTTFEWVELSTANLNTTIAFMNSLIGQEARERDSTILYHHLHSVVVPLLISLLRDFRPSLDNPAKLEA